MAPELAGELGTAAAIGQIALLVFAVTAILRATKTLDRIQRQMIRDMASFEDEVRMGLGLTHAEFDELDRDIIGYATAWEQLQARIKEEGVTWDAMVDYVSTMIGTATEKQRAPAEAISLERGTDLWKSLIDWYTQVTDEIKEKLGSDSGVIYNDNLEAGIVE